MTYVTWDNTQKSGLKHLNNQVKNWPHHKCCYKRCAIRLIFLKHQLNYNIVFHNTIQFISLFVKVWNPYKSWRLLCIQTLILGIKSVLLETVQFTMINYWILAIYGYAKPYSSSLCKWYKKSWQTIEIANWIAHETQE